MNLESYQKFNAEWGDVRSSEALKEAHPTITRSIEIEQLLTSFTNAFRNPLKPPQVKEYAKDIEKTGVSSNQLNQVFTGLRGESEQMPSLAHLLYKIRSVMPKEPAKIDQLETGEDRLFKELREKFLSIMTEEQLSQFCLYWVKNVYPDLFTHGPAYGLTFNVFERCALIDWKESGFKDALKAIERGKIKASK